MISFLCSGLGAEEPLSSQTDVTGSPLSTGYNTRSSSEEVVHGSGRPSTPARTRTASELLLDRSVDCG